MMRLHDENKNQMNFFKITLVGNCLKNSGYANLVAYIEIGMEQDLEEQLFSNQKKRECLEEKKEKIKKIVFGLLEYHAYMTSEEVSLLVRLLNCYLIRNPIISINFDIPENERTNLYDNQYEVLQSIFDMQNMVNVFVRNNISR